MPLTCDAGDEEACHHNICLWDDYCCNPVLGRWDAICVGYVKARCGSNYCDGLGSSQASKRQALSKARAERRNAAGRARTGSLG